MVDPSRPRKEGIRCDGTLKKGVRGGEKCDGLVLGKDDLSVICHNCGRPHALLDLLNEVMEQGYLTSERVLGAVPSLDLKKQVRDVKTEKGARYFEGKLNELFEDVFDDSICFRDRHSFASQTKANSMNTMITLESRTVHGLGPMANLVSDDGIVQFFAIRVYGQDQMKNARRFARRLETLTKRIQETPSQVTVVQDFF